MKRFLKLLGIAAIAGVMYVAAAPGSALHAGPSWKQYLALKKQVAALKTKVTNVQTEADGEAGVLLHCMLHSVVGVNQKGDPAGTFGYGYAPTATTPGTTSTFTTALDLAPNGTTPTYLIAPFNSDPQCQQFVGVAGAQHAAAVFAQQR